MQYSFQTTKVEKILKVTYGFIPPNLVLAHTEDISERKKIEDQLKESEEMYRKAYYQANLYRDIFAHDLSNILQNIQSSAELSSLYLNNPEKLYTIKELHEIIHEQITRGRKLIENVRKITEIDESEPHLDKIEILEILNNAIEFLKGSFLMRTLNIQVNTFEKKIYVIANNLLLDVFENILINAVRHNNKSKIQITVNINEYNLEDKNYVKWNLKIMGSASLTLVRKAYLRRVHVRVREAREWV